MSLLDVRNRLVELIGDADLSSDEKVFNGDFSGSAYGWTLADGWSYNSSNDRVVHTAGATNTGTLVQAAPICSLVDKKFYRVSFVIYGHSAGTVKVSLGSADYGQTISATALGGGQYQSPVTVTITSMPCAGTSEISFTPTYNFNWQIADVSVTPVELTADSTFICRADRFINEGVKVLDDLARVGEELSQYPIDIAAGQNLVYLTKCRAVERVWVSDADGRAFLGKALADQILRTYSAPTADLDQGLPLYYAVIAAPNNPLYQMPEAVWSFDKLDEAWVVPVQAEAVSYANAAILFAPPADAAYTMTIEGFFESPTLLENTDTNRWTENRSDILVHAAWYRYCAMMEDPQGAQMHMAIIQQAIRGMLRDKAEQRWQDVTALPD